MASNPLFDIVMAAAQLKAAAPQFYGQLCDALRAYEVQAIAEILAADVPHEMFRAQGKIKTVQQLRKHLNEATELRETYTRRDANARPQPTG
jgi:hypothetical protein